MKRNVDLTEDRVFHRRTEFIYLDELLNEVINGQFPWRRNGFKVIHSEDDELHKKRLIPLGNRKEREMEKIYQRASSNKHCDCCGKPLDRFPWSKSPLLICKECNEELEISVDGKFPWNRRK